MFPKKKVNIPKRQNSERKRRFEIPLRRVSTNQKKTRVKSSLPSSTFRRLRGKAKKKTESYLSLSLVEVSAMVLRSENTWTFLLTLAIISGVSQSLHFELRSGRTKCISEDIKSNSMTVGKYTVVKPDEAHPSPPSHKISIRVLSKSFLFLDFFKFFLKF